VYSDAYDNSYTWAEAQTIRVFFFRRIVFYLNDFKQSFSWQSSTSYLDRAPSFYPKVLVS
jgi:hypothetical protein